MDELIIAYAAKGLWAMAIMFLARIPFDIVVDAFRGGR